MNNYLRVRFDAAHPSGRAPPRERVKTSRRDGRMTRAREPLASL
jgi:hypothetical protein